MRKNFVLFVLIPLIIVAVVVYFFIDRWVEAGLEYGGESAVGAKVEIDNLSVTLSPVGIRFSRLQVSNPFVVLSKARLLTKKRSCGLISVPR